MKAPEDYKVCSRCILDNNDYPDISFNEQGICNVCATYDEMQAKRNKIHTDFALTLENLIADIKKDGIGKRYDCVLGISGGVDSTYLAIKIKEWGIRPLAVHVDNNWNSELAVSNISKILKSLNFDLFTYVVNWEELRDLERAYMKASVLDIDIPNEMCFQAMLYRVAAKYKLKHIVTGHNDVTEGWLPPSMTYLKIDTLNMWDIHRRFGKVKLKTYPKIGVFRTYYYSKIKKIKYVSPLNFCNYNKDEAKNVLIENYGWRDYGNKHYENIYTRFYQSYILVEKFGIDKRKAHFSSLICSGQMTREEALLQMKKSPYANEESLKSDREYFIKKVGLTEAEFVEYINTPPKNHTDYFSYMGLYNRFRRQYRFIKKTFGGFKK